MPTLREATRRRARDLSETKTRNPGAWRRPIDQRLVQPAIGRQVMVEFLRPALESWHHVCGGVITRVHTEDCVNVTAFPDMSAPICLESVLHKSVIDGAQVTGEIRAVWYWPPKPWIS